MCEMAVFIKDRGRAHQRPQSAQPGGAHLDRGRDKSVNDSRREAAGALLAAGCIDRYLYCSVHKCVIYAVVGGGDSSASAPRPPPRGLTRGKPDRELQEKLKDECYFDVANVRFHEMQISENEKTGTEVSRLPAG